MKRIRCAIYTRKSSDEGLEQDFNSLDAQREACAAYVLSQASEGWQLVPEHYDDGGVSGGTLERPALQRLLADVAEGKVDIIVVYKVDRLTRSLLDFAKLVEALDRAGTSFVSVTQSFNTTTSMGRLTLNMLLSFAQFEREVTAEHIRDKLAASKAKGMWMGGTPPLGYRPDGRTLAIVEEHAAIVRGIYDRYLALGSVRQLADQLADGGIGAPLRVRSTGRAYGGVAFTRGQLYHILRNPVYAGQIAHREKRYPGLHPPIIEQALWDRVQARLADNTQGEQRARLPHRSLLAGLIVDETGEPMLASHASKNAVRYRYYVSRSLQTGGSTAGLRLPAREIEQLVQEQVARVFDDPLDLASRLALAVTPAHLAALDRRCAELARSLRAPRGDAVRGIVSRVTAGPRRLAIELSPARIAAVLGLDPPPALAPSLELEADYRLTRTGRAVRLVQSDGTHPQGKTRNPALVNLVVEAHKLWSRLSAGDIEIAALARQLGRNDSYVTRLVRMAFLAPDVVEAILDGHQHGALDARTLRGTNAVPASWQEQVAKFLPATGPRRSNG